MKGMTRTVKLVCMFMGVVSLGACDDAADNNPGQKKIYKDANHVEMIEGTPVRCSAVNSTQLPEESASRHSIVPDPNTGVLSCVAPLADSVTANYRTLGTAPRNVDLRRVMEHSNDTWLGTYSISSSFPVQFDITVARPGTEPVVFEFNTEDS